MITAEIFKIRKHRTPYVLTAFGALATVGPSIYYLFRSPDTATAYADTAMAVFLGIGILLSAVFGGWILGHEYRQGTVKRVVSVDARRGRLLAAKAVAGTGVYIAMLVTMLAAGIGAAAAAAAINGDQFVTEDFVRTSLSMMFPMVITALTAFGLSAIFRSDTYAMLGAVGAMTVFAPLLQLIPTVGDYSLAAVTYDVASRIGSADEVLTNSFTTSLVGTIAWMAAFGVAGHQLFTRRDI